MAAQVEDKTQIAHLDTVESKDADRDYEKGTAVIDAKIEDNFAADYVDPTLTISEEENKRLKKMLYTR